MLLSFWVNGCLFFVIIVWIIWVGMFNDVVFLNIEINGVIFMLELINNCGFLVFFIEKLFIGVDKLIMLFFDILLCKIVEILFLCLVVILCLILNIKWFLFLFMIE